VTISRNRTRVASEENFRPSISRRQRVFRSSRPNDCVPCSGFAAHCIPRFLPGVCTCGLFSVFPGTEPATPLWQTSGFARVSPEPVGQPGEISLQPRWPEYGRPISPVKAGLRPPPSAAYGLDMAYWSAFVGHQAFDGEDCLMSGKTTLPLVMEAFYRTPSDVPLLTGDVRTQRTRSECERGLSALIISSASDAPC
jgi:hypothetical protein